MTRQLVDLPLKVGLSLPVFVPQRTGSPVVAGEIARRDWPTTPARYRPTAIYLVSVGQPKDTDPRQKTSNRKAPNRLPPYAGDYPLTDRSPGIQSRL